MYVINRIIWVINRIIWVINSITPPNPGRRAPAMQFKWPAPHYFTSGVFDPDSGPTFTIFNCKWLIVGGFFILLWDLIMKVYPSTKTYIFPCGRVKTFIVFGPYRKERITVCFIQTWVLWKVLNWRIINSRIDELMNYLGWIDELMNSRIDELMN